MHARRAERRPRKADQTNRLERGQPQQYLKPTLGQEAIVALALADRVVAPEAGEVHKVREEVGGVDGDKGPGLRENAEVPLGVDLGKGLEEGKNEGVGEAR